MTARRGCSPAAAPARSEELLPQAIALHECGRLAEAAALYDRVLEDDPNEPNALHLMGLVQHQRGDTPAGAAFIRRAIALMPDFPEAHNNLGQLLRDCGDTAESAAAFAEAVRLQPDYVLAWRNLRDTLQAAGRAEDAIAAAETVARLQPESAAAQFELADLLLAGNHGEAAVAACRRAVERDADNFTAHMKLIRVLDRLGQVAAARDAVRQWRARAPDDAFAQHMAAALLGEAAPPRAADGYVRNLFDSTAESFDAHLAKLDYRAPDLILRAFTIVADELSADLDILDAGCGTGLCGPLLRPLVRSLVGVDLSPGMLAQACAKGCYDTLKEAELTGFLNEQPERFDAVISADTFCYFGDLAGILSATEAALRPGGYVIFTVEATASTDEDYALGQHGRYAHSETYVRSSLAAAGLALRRLGFDRLRYESARPVLGLVVTAEKSALRLPGTI